MSVNPLDVIRATARLRTSTGETILNTYHYKYEGSGAIDLTQCAVAIAAAFDDMYSTIQPAIPADVSFIDIDFQDVTNGEVGPAMPWPSLTVGGGSGDTMPEQNCALCVGHTSVPKVVARKFLGPFIEADNSDGSWASGLVTVLADFALSWLTVPHVTLGDLIPGVARYVVGGLVDRFVPIESTSTSSGIFTQRRRRRGVGV